MAQLNTMFQENANTMFRGGSYIGKSMPIDDSMKRFYKASGMTKAELVKAMDGKQTLVNNWEKRGVSQDGALTMQRLWGLNAVWILSGEGSEKIDAWPLPDQGLLSVVRSLGRDERVELQGIIKAFLMKSIPSKPPGESSDSGPSQRRNNG